MFKKLKEKIESTEEGERGLSSVRRPPGVAMREEMDESKSVKVEKAEEVKPPSVVTNEGLVKEGSISNLKETPKVNVR